MAGDEFGLIWRLTKLKWGCKGSPVIRRMRPDGMLEQCEESQESMVDEPDEKARVEVCNFIIASSYRRVGNMKNGSRSFHGQREGPGHDTHRRQKAP